MAESGAAIVKGFETLRPEAAPIGVILNRIASTRHLELVSNAIEKNCQAEILGYLPRTLEFEIPSRHLGLLTSDEAPLSPQAIQLLAETVEKHIDLARIIELFNVARSVLQQYKPHRQRLRKGYAASGWHVTKLFVFTMKIILIFFVRQAVN